MKRYVCMYAFTTKTFAIPQTLYCEKSNSKGYTGNLNLQVHCIRLEHVEIHLLPFHGRAKAIAKDEKKMELKTKAVIQIAWKHEK